MAFNHLLIRPFCSSQCCELALQGVGGQTDHTCAPEDNCFTSFTTSLPHGGFRAAADLASGRQSGLFLISFICVRSCIGILELQRRNTARGLVRADSRQLVAKQELGGGAGGGKGKHRK